MGCDKCGHDFDDGIWTLFSEWFQCRKDVRPWLEEFYQCPKCGQIYYSRLRQLGEDGFTGDEDYVSKRRMKEMIRSFFENGKAIDPPEGCSRCIIDKWYF